MLPALAITAGAQAQPPQDAWRINVETGATYQWESGIDDGGDVSMDSWAVSIGASRAWTPTLRAGVSAGFLERRYAFSGSQGFGGLDPWDDVTDVSLSASLNWRADDRWNVFAVPTVRWAAERGASLDDGRTEGLLAAASYRVNDRLSIGPGFGVFSELEDSTDWFPILAIDWRITDTLSLRTGGGFAATRGPGLFFNWKPSERWHFSLGGRYEKIRFRLDDDGIAPDGIGQERSIPVFLGVTRNFGNLGSFSLIAGSELGGQLRIEDEDGQRLYDSDYDTSPFAGATLDLRF
ncbi:MAG: TonB-dependent receptor [Thiohalocapsa sp.]|nr:TonB-dependent receptor [Thiohalocapsa sp.]